MLKRTALCNEPNVCKAGLTAAIAVLAGRQLQQIFRCGAHQQGMPDESMLFSSCGHQSLAYLTCPVTCQTSAAILRPRHAHSLAKMRKGMTGPHEHTWVVCNELQRDTLSHLARAHTADLLVFQLTSDRSHKHVKLHTFGYQPFFSCREAVARFGT